MVCRIAYFSEFCAALSNMVEISLVYLFIFSLFGSRVSSFCFTCKTSAKSIYAINCSLVFSDHLNLGLVFIASLFEVELLYVFNASACRDQESRECPSEKIASNSIIS